ncbi:MAG: serine--tRNA ligase [Euryarchaeota archaeon]|nr:serine--tRNA ligase [Euryarchaeota archaeon]
MLDIRLFRENPELVRRDLKRRGAVEKLKQVDEIIALDKEWRSSLTRLNELRRKRNELSREISRLKARGEDISAKVAEIRRLPEEIKRLEARVEELESKLKALLMRMPNLLHESVPVGESEEDNVVVRTWGEPRRFDFPARDHISLALLNDLFDIERAAKVAGSRFYYLKNQLVKLNYALISFALDFLAEKGFTLLQPPYMLRRAAEEAATDLADFEDVIYKIEGEDLYLIPTSEHAILAMHMDEILDGRALPLRYAGVSPCFRKEAGAHGRDTKGIFRVHQFEKVEQFVFSRPEDSWEEHERLLANAEEVYQKLGIPYRVVNICTGDIGTVAAKKYDIEAWLPGQGKYREVVSCSNCTDYQARRARIRFRDAPNKPTQYVHTLNSTLIATERTLVAILENYQREDGSIEVPRVLVPYTGFEEIRAE